MAAWVLVPLPAAVTKDHSGSTTYMLML